MILTVARLALLVPFVLMVLAACSAPDKEIVYTPQRVEIPVVASCQKQEIVEPNSQVDQLTKDASLEAIMKATLSDLSEWMGYAGKLKANLAACP